MHRYGLGMTPHSHPFPRIFRMDRWTKIGLGSLAGAFCAVVVAGVLPIGDAAADAISVAARVVNLAVLTGWAIRWAMQWHRTKQDAVSVMELSTSAQWLMRACLGVIFVLIVMVGVFSGGMLEWPQVSRLAIFAAFLIAGTVGMVLLVVESVASIRQARVDSERMDELMDDLLSGMTSQNGDGS